MTSPDENRALVLTAPGPAAIAVVRLSGPAVEAFVQLHFSRPTRQGRCVHGFLSEGQRIIDDPVVVRLSSDAADINLHGGAWVVQAMLELAKSHGFKILDPANDAPVTASLEAPTILWAEVLQALPKARTEPAARMLLSQPGAWLDLQQRARECPLRLEDLRSIEQDAGLSCMLSLPTVAIIGPANVGKSTLANQLFGQTRSITADEPGTTRDWVGEFANIDGLAVLLIDTAGRRATADPIEAAAITAGAAQVLTADLVVVVLDRSKPLEHAERNLLSAHPNTIRIANKADQAPAWDSHSIDAIDTVAISGQGIPTLRQAIRRHFDTRDDPMDRPRCWTARQRLILARARTDPIAILEI